MRHRMSGKQLSRNTSHRIAMRRNMAASLFEHGAIHTTETKAKELRGFVERLITTARKGTLHARRLIIAELGGDREAFDHEGELQDKTIVQKLMDEIAPRYADRPGGYTRIIRLAERRIGDAGKKVILQLVEAAPTRPAGPSKGASRRRRRAAKRHEAGAAGAAASAGAQAPGPVEPAVEAPPEEPPQGQTDTEDQAQAEQ